MNLTQAFHQMWNSAQYFHGWWGQNFLQFISWNAYILQNLILISYKYYPVRLHPKEKNIGRHIGRHATLAEGGLLHLPPPSPPYREIRTRPRWGGCWRGCPDSWHWRTLGTGSWSISRTLGGCGLHTSTLSRWRIPRWARGGSTTPSSPDSHMTLIWHFNTCTLKLDNKKWYDDSRQNVLADWLFHFYKWTLSSVCTYVLMDIT